MTINYDELTVEQMNNMSDDDFAKLDPTKLPNVMITDDGTSQPVEENVVPEQEPTPPTQELEQPVEQPTTPGVDPNEGAPSVVVDEATGAEPSAGVTPDATATPPTTDPATPDTPAEVSREKAFFDKVTAKFNANGREMQVDNEDDVVALMQKGLNYNQKMGAMKPHLKMLRALEDKGIKSIEDLGYLFDLQAHNPAAIAKLLKDSGHDTYELDEDKANGYVPSTPQVSEELINFEAVANALDSNPHFGTVVEELKTFDEQTKQEIFKNPSLLNVLTDHVSQGYYNKIRAELDKQQAVGRLNGMPFLQAYGLVGDMLFKNPEPQTQPTTAPVVPPVATPAPVAQAVPVAQKPNPSNNAARQAAAGTTSTAATVQKITMTPEELWSLSDDEFAKLDPKFLTA